LVVGDKVLAVVFVAVGVAVFGDSLLSGALVPFVKNVIHTDARGFGWLMTARGAGGLVGSLVIGSLAFVRPPRMLALSLVALGAIIFGAIVFRPLPAELALIALAGIPAIGWIVAEQTILQTRVPDELRGRVFATYMTTAALLGTLGLLIAGALVSEVGAVTVLCVTAGLYAVGGVIGLVMIPAEASEGTKVPAEESRTVAARPA
jgi:MFS family permease